jgi:diguanylate cyclase (GGDEF)-like protein/PAS domain S-box-containing protein
VRNEAGRASYWLGVRTDITGRKEAEERYRTLVERMPAVTYIEEVGDAHRTLYMSPQIEDMLGYPQEDWLGGIHHWTLCLHPEDRERVLAEDAHSNSTGEPFKTEYRMLRRNGETVWVRDEAVLVEGPGGRGRFWQGVITDITGRKALEARLEHQALHDSLTGLPNRRLFNDRLVHALARTRRGGGVAVLFLDLDDFKVVNDSLGHEAGDLLLTVVAQRLGRCLRPEDTLARFGGDEFVVLLEEVGDPSEAVRVAQRITEELRRPFSLDGRELYASASVGISFGTARSKSPDALLRDADTAMYRAKEGGADFRVFDSAMYERVVRRLDLENDLRRAVEQGEFVLHYQPIFDFGSQRVWGTEALVRWAHPERGLLGPPEFVPLAEETGLIIPVGSWALEEACLQTKEWQDSLPRDPPLGVIVNLSARQLRHPECEETIRETLSRSGLSPESLSLDVTETAFIDALEDNRLALERIQALGVRISIDDFGMGYSSLSYLKRLPADALKIDKSFLKGFGEDVEDTAIVRMVIEVGHTLGLRVVAEGVETWTQAALLAETGCDMAQGYHFSKPLLPEEVQTFLGEQSA